MSPLLSKHLNTRKLCNPCATVSLKLLYICSFAVRLLPPSGGLLGLNCRLVLTSTTCTKSPVQIRFPLRILMPSSFFAVGTCGRGGTASPSDRKQCRCAKHCRPAGAMRKCGAVVYRVLSDISETSGVPCFLWQCKLICKM